MSKSNPYELVDRKQFVDTRYQRFTEARPMLEAMGDGAIWTDLDRDYGDGLMRDIVICDMCNEDINEPNFVIYEQDRCYHIQCVKEDLPPDMDFNNVVFVDFKKPEASDVEPT